MMDLREYRDGLEAGIESLTENAADCQLLLVELVGRRGKFETVHSLKDGRTSKMGKRLPMWPFHRTSEQSTDRGSDGEYLYFYWRHGRGPTPKAGGRMQRKTYVGARPVQIALAREMETNLDTAEGLDREIREVEAALRASERNLSQAEGVLVRVLDRVDGGEGGNV